MVERKEYLEKLKKWKDKDLIKYILTMDIEQIADYDGIKKINVLDWLLEK